MYDEVYGTGTVAAPITAKHNLKTGSQVPVEIMAEVDRKIDDGLPYAGGFQYSVYVPNAGTPLTPSGLRHRGRTAGRVDVEDRWEQHELRWGKPLLTVDR